MDLERKIKSEISLKKKDIRLDKFISKALYKNQGYYINKKVLGKKNDFITAPEISQMYGEIIGLYFFYFWKTKINSKFNFIELGPGNGTLFIDISKSLYKYSDFFENAKIKFIEINKNFIKIQKEKIKKIYPNARWAKTINFNYKNPSIIYSNEFFDCFPVRQFVFKNSWFEKYISFNNNEDKLFFKDHLVKNKKLISLLDAYKKQNLFEVSIERNKYFENICKFIKNNGGLFFTVDYGYIEKLKNFTLQAIQNHKFSHVLENIGEKDISSHVNFSELKDIALKYKLKIEEYCTQREFLTKHGIFERKFKLSQLNNERNFDKELNRLISNDEMGQLFKCLVVSNLK